MILGEVPAEAPALINLLGPLVQICGLIVGLSAIVLLAYAVKGLLQGIANWLSFLPGVGGVAAAAVTGVEQKISNALGQAIAGIESNIGHQWHSFSRVLGMLWAEQKLVAQNLWHLVQATNRLVTTGDVSHLLHTLENAIHGAERTITRDVTKTVHTTVTRVEALGHAVLPRLRVVEHAISTTIPREIKYARDLAREAEDGVTRLWDRVRALEAGVGAGAIAAAIAAALAAIGLDWLSCKDGARRVGRSGCGLWDDLGNLFGLLIDGLIFVDLCQVIPSIEGVLAEFEAPLVELISTAANAACAHPPGGWTTLPAPPLDTPTADELTATL